MKTITLTLTENEAQALAGMLDAAVRHLGLRAVKDAANLTDKLDAAITASQEESTDD